MRSVSAVTLLFSVLSVDAFTASTTLPATRASPTVSYAYVPDGLTAAQYKQIKDKEKAAQQNLGKLGPRGFKSRSFQSFHEALERGEAAHLMPVTNAKERVRKGEIRQQDIPYMQRGGSWDNSDVKGAKKAKWLKSDKSYANGGFMKEQSVSVFGYGAGLDWTGSRGKVGPSTTQPGRAVTPKNYKAPKLSSMVKKSDQKDQPKKKGLFGMF